MISNKLLNLNYKIELIMITSYKKACAQIALPLPIRSARINTLSHIPPLPLSMLRTI